jgi:large subunit ribosomal protein L23
MRSPYEIVKRPLIMTEKGERLKEEDNQFLFEVDIKASKREIKAAVEKLFNVGVVQVRTMVVRGKMSRLGRRRGKRPNWKKAVVTLIEGDTIEFFEGV